jgi:TrmH family RNA methyltransferase
MRLKKYDRDVAHSYTFGVFPTLELLRWRAPHVQEVLLHSRGNQNEGVAKITALCRDAGIPVEVNDKLIERLTPKENTYAVGVFRKYAMQLDARADQVVLVHPGDMGNLGTISRTLLGFGYANLALIRPAADSFDPRVIRASMGAIFQLAFSYFDTFESYRAAFGDQRLYPFMTDGRARLDEATFERPAAFIFGGESGGLPPVYHDYGLSVSIPHQPAIDSLNLAVAVGIALYVARRV